jgi:glycosyltransferase involved in cell wall biosynthesis
MELTILMPCLNEAETLAVCISKAKNWLSSEGISGEVLIADNGSSDGSQRIARALGARVLEVSTRGYGAALYAGASNAKGRFVIMGDSDDSYDFSNLMPFLEELRKGTDLVMGNRFAGGIEKGAMPWKNRYIGNPALSFLGRFLFKIPVRDFHCGLRGFSKAAFHKMGLRTTGMEFASEMVIKTKVLGMKISEVPTTLSVDGRSRPPHLNPWRDGWRHLRFMLALSPKWTFFIPGVVLMTLGLAFYVPLLFGNLQIGSFVLSTNGLYVSSTIFVIGFVQMILGVAVRIFATREGLLPSSEVISKTLRRPIFEIGSIVGLAILGLGIFGIFQSIDTWGVYGFAELPPNLLARQINLSGTLGIIGGITVASSLLFGFLSLPMQNLSSVDNSRREQN